MPPHKNGSIVFARLCQCAPPYNTCVNAPIRVPTPNGISIGSAVLHISRQRVPILYSGLSLSPQNCPFALGIPDLDTHRIHGSFGPPESTSQPALQSVQPFLQAHDRDRQADQQTTLLPSVTIGRIYVILRCGVINNTQLLLATVILGIEQVQACTR